MYKTAHQTGIKDVYIPLPSYFRPSDEERLCRALRARENIYGDVNPDEDPNWRSVRDNYAAFRTIQNKRHVFTNFRLTDKGIKADLVFLCKELVAYEGNFELKRRSFNDLWFSETSKIPCPGLFGIDVYLLRS